MSKKRTKSRIKKPRIRKKLSKSTGSLYRTILEKGKSVKLTSPYAKRAAQLKKINYKKAAAKIRLFESLPFNNRVNFNANQKRAIARRWKVVRYYQNIIPGPKVSPQLKKTNAVISRGRLILNKKKGFRRIVYKWYVLDTIGSRREYTIFLSQKELYQILVAESPFEELKAIVLTRKPQGFLLTWAMGRVPEDEMFYSWIYGAYPAGRISQGSFDRYTVEHLKKETQRRKITAVRLIYHVGGFDG